MTADTRQPQEADRDRLRDLLEDMPSRIATVYESVEMAERLLRAGVTLATAALDVERLARALQVHQHSAAVIGYCYKGHGEDTRREAEAISAAYALEGPATRDGTPR